jgi:ABC-type phosphonate transport system ATPase subunit
MRIVVVGTSGSGKTTLAKALAAQLALPYIELDALNWHDRAVVMYRVIRRSLVRAMLRTELWAGNRERWLHMLRPSHPIRWAWSTWCRRRREFEERIGQRDYADLVVLRLRRPREAEKLIRQLM